MDVFIPEEYVIKRRLEKKAAANAPKVIDGASESGKGIIEREEKAQPRHFRLENNEFMVSANSSVFSENVVYSCFSA